MEEEAKAHKLENDIRLQKEAEAREWEVAEREKLKRKLEQAAAAKVAAAAAELASRTPILVTPTGAAIPDPSVLGLHVPSLATVLNPKKQEISAQAAKAVSETLAVLSEKSPLAQERVILEELKTKHGKKPSIA
jgi:hypothetical protein